MAINPLELAIGKGVLFPIQLSEKPDGTMSWLPVTADINLIQNNLRSVLLYQLGFRLREEYFGTRLSECLEEPNTQALLFLVRLYIKTAIEYWEPRLNILEVTTIPTSKQNISIRVDSALNGQPLDSLFFNFNLQTGDIHVSK